MKKLLILIIIILSCSFLNVYAKENLKVTNVRVIEQSGDITVENLIYENNNISSEIVFNEVGDFVTFEVEIKNNTNDLFQLDSITKQLDNDYFDVSSSAMGNYVQKGETGSFSIKIIYTEQLMNELERTVVTPSVSLHFIENNELVNPKTMSYFKIIIRILFLLMIIMLVYILIKNKKGKMILLFILLIPLFVYAKEENEITISFTTIKYRGMYSNGDNTTYKVIHKQMDLDGENYTIVDTVTKRGVAKTNVTPNVNSYTGFTAPERQTVTLKRDGTTEVVYLYTRNKYQLTLNDSDYITTTTPSGKYFYGTSINLKAKDRTHYSFQKWSDNNTNIDYTFTLSGNKTIGPIYERIKFTISLNANGGNVNQETIIVNSGDAIGSLPTPTSTKNHTTFLGWYSSLQENSQQITSSYIPSGNITIYAKWEYHPESTLENGTYLNIRMKKEAGATGNVFVSTEDNNIEQIKVGESLPNNFTPTANNTISKSESDEPIYIWYDSNDKILYYYTDAEKIYLSSGYGVFRDFRSLQSIENINSWDTSNNTTLDTAFYYTGYNAQSFNINLSNWNTSNVKKTYMAFYNCGSNATTWSIGDISNWDVSKVNDMSSMFAYAAYNAETFNLNLSSWSPSSATNMSSMFNGAGYKAETFNLNLSSWTPSSATNMQSMFNAAGYSATTWNIGDLSEWDVSQVTNMGSMFSVAAYNAETFNLNLSSWNTSNVTNMASMFNSAGYNATTWSVGDLSDWSTSAVTNTSAMFYSAGQNATTWSVGDLSSWNTSNVENMSSMFYYTGYNATTWSVGDLSSWNVSSVTDMSYMFCYSGYNATTWSIGDISEWVTSNVTNMNCMFSRAAAYASVFDIGNLDNWDVSNVTNMYQMFCETGSNASDNEDSLWNIGDLSSWNTANVSTMGHMFFGAGRKAKTWNSIGTLKIYASEIDGMFFGCYNAKATLEIHNKPTKYGGSFPIFSNAASNPGALITVNYTAEVDNIDDIIAAKSSNSHVVKGSLITTS